MTIVWIADKHLDVSVDRATWTETVRHLIRLGHRVILITGHKTDSRPDFGLGSSIRYITSSNRKKIAFFSFHARVFVELVRVLASIKPDVLLFHPFTCLTVLPVLLLRKAGLLGVRCVLDVRTLPVEFSGMNSVYTQALFDFSMHAARNLCDGTTVITPFMRDVLSVQYHLRADRTGIWTSGASEDLFSGPRVDRKAVGELKRSLGLKNRFVLIYHGVFSPNRGLQETLAAMSILIRKNKRIMLLLVGNGNARDELDSMVHSLHLQDHVRILGPVPLERIPAFIASAHAGVLPFPALMWWRVSSPIKLMEYLAMGKPVIVTDIEAHRDVLEGCPAAFFIRSNSPECIARGILDAYGRRGRLQQLGEAGLKRFRERYTWQAQTLHLESYLNSLVGRAKSL
jgi:glycosyltransferase involved in cell wall biosynthesis